MTDNMSQSAGRLTDIWVADEGSAPMEQRRSIQAVEGGLAGDRYQTGEGYYAPFDTCEVTLIAGEAIDTIDTEFGIDLTDGRHRRNLVTRGVDLDTLLEYRFAIGGAVFEGTRPRPPCAHVQELAGEDELAAAMGDDRGGICADVVEPGEFGVGDEVVRLESTTIDPDDIAAAIQQRQE